MAQTERREVGPLFSWLPMRHLTRHGEVWLDQGSQGCAGMSAQSLISGWQKVKTTAHFHFLLVCHWF